MKLLEATFKNFGSYTELELDFSNMTLALIYGSTGSGKSTIPDMACWVLFGVTAKGGNVDEVRSWHKPDEVTEGTIDVQLQTGLIRITRIRGNSQQNDLYWTEDTNAEVQIRGKDLSDTQKLLDKRLGVDATLYRTAAYYSEFSDSAAFFLSTAKERRKIFDLIADLDLPVSVAERAAETRKEDKKALIKATEALENLKGQETQLKSSKQWTEMEVKTWQLEHEKSLDRLKQTSDNFSYEKDNKILDLKHRQWNFEQSRNNIIQTSLKELARLEGVVCNDADLLKEVQSAAALSTGLSLTRCEACGGPKTSEAFQASRLQYEALKDSYSANKERLNEQRSHKKTIEKEQSAENPYTKSLTELVDSTNNPYEELLVEERVKPNPFLSNLSHHIAKLNAITFKLDEQVAQVSYLNHRVTSLNTLYDLSLQLRGELLKKAVKDIEVSTNEYLAEYFDSEISVVFSIESGDSLEVAISKNGYPCVYRQLSKGQRTLLKLCFSISIMNAAANRAGIQFDTLFFDESLDGLDSSLKVKAFRLFETLSLEHPSVLVIEHNEQLQDLFHTRYKVTMEEDTSVMEQEYE